MRETQVSRIVPTTALIFSCSEGEYNGYKYYRVEMVAFGKSGKYPSSESAYREIKKALDAAEAEGIGRMVHPDAINSGLMFTNDITPFKKAWKIELGKEVE